MEMCREVLAKAVPAMLFLCMVAFPASTARAGGTIFSSPYLPTLDSYIQLRYTDPDTGKDRLAVRRFKIMLDGGPAEAPHYHIQGIYKANNGSATDDQVFLQDAYLIYPTGGNFSFKLGQFVPPFGLERFQPDKDLDFVDRTDVTNRLVVNGNLGNSFARDRGAETDWTHGGLDLSAGLFDGSGANNGFHGSGPLGVARISYGRNGALCDRKWSWKAGAAQSFRHDSDLNLSGQLPGLNKAITGHFTGQDNRFNAFAQAGWGPLRAQFEYFRLWLPSETTGEIAATGAYGQVAYLPVDQVILALRHEWFNPDLHADIPFTGQWAAGITYDFRCFPLRLAMDYTWPDDGAKANFYAWRFQLQYVFLNKFKRVNG